MSIHRGLLRSGFVVFLLSLLVGLAIPFLLNPRMALAAHVTGLMLALLLIALSVVWDALGLSPGRAKLVRGLYLYGAYASLTAGVLGAIWGTRRVTPIAGAGFHASAAKELVVQVLFVSLGLALLAATALVVLSLYRRAR
jgi:(hydroxyamino)benzene mutase